MFTSLWPHFFGPPCIFGTPLGLLWNRTWWVQWRNHIWNHLKWFYIELEWNLKRNPFKFTSRGIVVGSAWERRPHEYFWGGRRSIKRSKTLHQVALTVHHPNIKLTLWPTFCFQKNFVSDRTDLTSSDGLCPSPPWPSSRRPVEEKVATVMVKISRIVGDVHINHSYSSGGVFLSPRCTPQAPTRSVQPLLQGTRSRSVHRWWHTDRYTTALRL